MLAPPSSLTNSEIELWDSLCTRLITLNERVWEDIANGPAISEWLKNFVGKTGRHQDIEKLHALYLLSQFMYFGTDEIRVLLKSLFRDLYLIPLAQRVRERTSSFDEFNEIMNLERASTRFLGVGNPSESGVHLLYYFRQENGLSKNAFLDAAQIYKSSDEEAKQRVLRYADVKRYVFIDDMCGSGETAVRYSTDLLPDLVNQMPDAELYYFSLFGTKDGLDRVRRESKFGKNCGAVYELDSSYKWADSNSRYFSNIAADLDRQLLADLAKTYGEVICPEHPLGYEQSQLLLGFSHNTPDNTLPVIWSDMEHGSPSRWYPIFRRYQKI